jgi:hypothetical protein
MKYCAAFAAVARLVIWIALLSVNHAVTAQEVWVEVIESFELPTDPAWFRAATDVARRFSDKGAFGVSVIRRFEAATSSRELLAEFQERLSRAGSNERSKKAVYTSIEKEVERIVASAEKTQWLGVVRGWDGIAAKEVVYILGERQRGVFRRCRPGQILAVTTSRSNCADHLQSSGRPTMLTAASGRRVPSEFLRVESDAPELRTVAFGTVDLGAVASGDWIGEAARSEGVGNTEVLVSFELPKGAVIESGFPWYCKFDLFERNADGTRGASVKFEGSEFAVCVSTAPPPPEVGGLRGTRGPSSDYTGVAGSRVVVRQPAQYGYEAVATAAWGVRVSAANTSGTPPSPQGGEVTPSTMPAETQPESLPELPQTPEIQP